LEDLEMKRKFWNVQIEVYEDGRVLAAVLRSKEAAIMPRDVYVRNPGREVFSLWYGSEAEAGDAVVQAKAMAAGKEVAA
jgi:hypothetical protein